MENLIEMLEDDDNDCKENDDCAIDNDEDCSQKMIQPADIKQEAMHPDLENIENMDDDELDDGAILDDDDDDDDDDEEDDSDYEGNDDIKIDGESNSPKKSKVTKNSVKKKTPEILIPQMVN